MTPQHHLPADIERTSMAIITEELQARGADIRQKTLPLSSESSIPRQISTMRRICSSRRGPL